MQEIITHELWLIETLPASYEEDQARFARKFSAATGYELWDVELYPQPNGKIAVIDFDQCRRVGS